MIAVTIGVGRWAKVALQSAREVTAKTGLVSRVLGEHEMQKLALPDCRDLKFRLFELVDADDIMYFDADQLCLNPWNPALFSGSDELIAVRDRPGDAVREDARKAKIPIDEYFNSGFFIVNRRYHTHWLREAEYLRRQPNSYRFYDQTHLNAARVNLGLPIHLLSAQYNWIRYGTGTFCFQLPVFMAHCTSLKELVASYFNDGWRPPDCKCFVPDGESATQLAGKVTIVRRHTGDTESVYLRADGVVLPAADPDDRGIWFAHRRGEAVILTFASYSKILGHFQREGGVWRELTFLESMPEREREFAVRLIDKRYFKFVRVGHASHILELLPDGSIGRGRSAGEQSWLMIAGKQQPELAIIGREGPTSRLRLINDGVWSGNLYRELRVQVELRSMSSPSKSAVSGRTSLLSQSPSDG